MSIAAIFTDPGLNAKARTAQLARMLEGGTVKRPELVAFAARAKPPVKATCLEALETVTKAAPAFLDEAAFDLCLQALSDKAPRVKWEAARVIGNTIHRFPARMDEAAAALLPLTAHEGTVVRWSAAFALARLIGSRAPVGKALLAQVEAIARGEEKNSIRKIYEAALREVRGPAA